MATVLINHERAETVFGTLLDRYRKQAFPYDTAKPPQRQENLPTNLALGSVEHANFLWAVCYYMRGGIKSDTAIIALARMYEAHSELFVPRHLHEDQSLLLGPLITEKLQRYGLGFNSTQIPRFWIDNARKLHRFWDGSAAQLFAGVGDYQELCQRIIGQGKRQPHNPNGFYGFQHKMVSMIAYFLQHAEIIEPLLFPVPVDFHVLRVLVANEILTVPGNDKVLPLPDLQQAARELTSSYCQQHHVSPVHLCDVLWLLSSETCNQNPGNFSEIGAYAARNTPVSRRTVNWTPTEIATHIRTCARCPIRNTCKHCIPSGPYYRNGILVIEQPRSEPPLSPEIEHYLAQGHGYGKLTSDTTTPPVQPTLIAVDEITSPPSPEVKVKPKRARRRAPLPLAPQIGSDQIDLLL